MRRGKQGLQNQKVEVCRSLRDEGTATGLSAPGEARWCPLVRPACGTCRRGPGGSDLLPDKLWAHPACKTSAVLPSTRSRRDRKGDSHQNWFVWWDSGCRDRALLEQASACGGRKAGRVFIKPGGGGRETFMMKCSILQALLYAAGLIRLLLQLGRGDLGSETALCSNLYLFYF